MNISYDLPSDTPSHVLEMQVSIVLKKTLTERLLMCADLTDFSYNMLKRQITDRQENISEGMLKFEMIKLLYPDCFDEDEIRRIKDHFVGLGSGS
jgi:hypothetical protein